MKEQQIALHLSYRWLRMVQRHFHAPVVRMYLSEEVHAAETKA